MIGIDSRFSACMPHNPADFVVELNEHKRIMKGFGGQTITIYTLEHLNGSVKMIKGNYTHS